MANIIIHFDIETTDSDAHSGRNGIHELAIIMEMGGTVVYKSNHYMKPLPKCIVNLNSLNAIGANYEDIMAYPDPSIAYNNIRNALERYPLLKGDKWLLSGFNSQAFDLPVLLSWWGSMKFATKDYKSFADWFHFDTLDTRILAANYLRSERHTMPDFKLVTVGKKLLPDVDIDETKAHNALWDASLSMAIYHRINDGV